MKQFFRKFTGTGLLLVPLIFLAFFTADASAVSELTVRSFLPKVESLEGGAELWLNTGVKSTKEANHTVFSTTYSYYSGKNKKLMNIIRKGQYETNVALYSFNNFVDASMYFRELTKDAPKTRSQQVRFGERGLFFLYPKSGYINDADFYLVFINKTFVVWIHSNDGFALMDIANPINDALDSFIIKNTKMFLIKKLHIEASFEGKKVQTQAVQFTTDYPASITVSGRVFSKELDPIPAATVNILETGDSLLTDSTGYFQHKILLDGVKDIQLAANFYLENDTAEEMTRFKGGLFETSLTYSDSNKRSQTWKIETAGKKLFGISYIKTSKGEKTYRLKGLIKPDGVMELTLDCSKDGSDFGCMQTFTGREKGGSIEGSWSGTGGGGSFQAETGGYRPVERKAAFTANTGTISTYAVNFKGELLNSTQNILNIGAGTDSNAMIHVKPVTQNLKLDTKRLISAKLVLTHLPDSQSGNLSIFKYSISDRNTNRKTLSASTYAGQIYKSEEPYKVEIDITDELAEGSEFVIGGVPEAGSYGNHMFSSVTSGFEALKPYMLITEYSKSDTGVKTARPFVFINMPKESDDRIGDRNKPGADGVNDWCYDAVMSYPGKKLTGFELEITSDIARRYNTNPLDIYPLVGVSSSIHTNKNDGTLEIPLEKTAEKLKICINGSYKPKATDKIQYKYYIDGRPVEGFAN